MRENTAGRARRPRKATAAVTLVLVLAVPPPGPAAERPLFATAGTLQTWCLGRGAVRASCLGYLAGAIDAMAGVRPPCLPPKLAGEQARLIVLDHLHRHPDRASAPAAAEVRAALAAAFPCPPGPPATPGAGPGERISRGRGPGAIRPLSEFLTARNISATC